MPYRQARGGKTSLTGGLGGALATLLARPLWPHPCQALSHQWESEAGRVLAGGGRGPCSGEKGGAEAPTRTSLWRGLGVAAGSLWKRGSAAGGAGIAR